VQGLNNRHPYWWYKQSFMTTTLILVIHLLLALALVGVILIQRSEGGGLGIGGNTSGGLMTTRGTANLLTRTTGVLAFLFMSTSLALAVLASHGHSTAQPSLFDQPAQNQTAPGDLPAAAPKDAEPATPSVPLGR
jgi:preprotein translocase subunit SecG